MERPWHIGGLERSGVIEGLEEGDAVAGMPGNVTNREITAGRIRAAIEASFDHPAAIEGQSLETSCQWLLTKHWLSG